MDTEKIEGAKQADDIGYVQFHLFFHPPVGASCRPVKVIFINAGPLQ